MPVLIVTLLLVGSLAVLAYPLFVRHGRALDEPADELTLQLRRARDRVYDEIRTLQQEYFLESVSEEDYRAQLQAARLRAAQLLREQQQVQQTVETIDQAVEEEMRRAAGEAPVPEGHKPVGRPPSSRPLRRDPP